LRRERLPWGVVEVAEVEVLRASSSDALRMTKLA
jgi:hypothetical protein